MRFFDITGELVGVLIVLITFAYLLRSLKVIFYNDTFNSLHHHRAIFISAFGVVILHYILSLYVIYFSNPTGFYYNFAYRDVRNFTVTAFHYMTGEHGREYFFTIGAELFRQFLSMFYYLFGPSSFLLASVVIFVFTASLVMFLKICILLGISIKGSLPIILFSLIPGYLLVTIEPYREGFLIFFLMSAIYYGIKFRMELRFIDMVSSIVFMILFGLFHFAAMAMAPFILFLLLFLPIVRTRTFLRFGKGFVFINKKVALTFIVVLAILSIVTVLFNYVINNYDVGHVVDLFRVGSFSDYVDKINEKKRNLIAVPGTNVYYWHLDNGSFTGLIASFFKAFLFYMFKPFVWEINSLSSLILGFESIVRFILLLFSMILVVKTKGQKRRLYFILLLIYFFIESIMALGTANAGTAWRHHQVAQWILVVLGGAGLVSFIKQFFRIALLKFTEN